MKQILQNMKTGVTELAEIPCPKVSSGQLLIRTSRTLISAGTERMLVDFGKANVIEKARQQPDKVRMVLNKMKTDGLGPTLDAVRNKLDQPLPLGYCNVGRVLQAGPGVTSFATGDRVASNGKHAEVVSVPANLCAKIPDSVTDESASFSVIGAVALQGIRLVGPTLGEAVVVTGLGLIGQITVQLLRAHGCRVLGIDYDSDKLQLAKSFGAEVVDLSAGEDPVKTAGIFSRGRGVDAVIVTASSKSSDPIHQAALMSRKRGRIVLVGVTGLELSRDDFYKKELTFQVSCSYGPGRHDADYEENGHDYPIGYVRWTEQRNFEAVLDMMADGRLNVGPLISHQFPIEQAPAAYELMTSGEKSLGILLQYADVETKSDASLMVQNVRISGVNTVSQKGNVPAVTFIGAGNYASSILMPAFKNAGASMRSVVSAAGVSGVHAAKKFGFSEATTDSESAIKAEDVDAVVIATRHNTHADFVLKALEAGKHVFVEKPLCLSLDQLQRIEGRYKQLVAQGRPPLLMVGFNRRFSPHVQKIKKLLAGVNGPKSFIMTVNAGAIPSEHWAQTQDVGGGRVLGEGCHFIDLLRFLAAAPIVSYSRCDMDSATRDTVTIQLSFADGSIGTIHYYANGSKALSKERLEVYASGRVLQLDNFRTLVGYDWPGFKKMGLWRQDKGQAAAAKSFVDALRDGGMPPIPISEIFEVARVSIALG